MRSFVWAALATGVLMAGVGVASASDTIRLGGPSAQSTIEGDVDTQLVRGGFHGHAGHFHGHAGHFHGHAGHFHGHAGFHGRGFFGAGFYRPYYYASYYRPYFYGSYYNPYYYTPYYYGTNYYYPCAGDSLPPATTLEASGYYQASAPQQYAPQAPINGNGTFQYDGGPRSPIPMPIPAQESNPAKTPRGIIPIDGRLVSLPTQATGGVSVPLTHVPAKTSAPRVTYPAYGE